jgi:YD repeat-containing protein
MIRIATFLFATTIAFAAATYSYDSSGRLSKVDYGNGATITYTYDNAGNLLTRSVTSGRDLAQNDRRRDGAVRVIPVDERGRYKRERGGPQASLCPDRTDMGQL